MFFLNFAKGQLKLQYLYKTTRLTTKLKQLKIVLKFYQNDLIQRFNDTKRVDMLTPAQTTNQSE